MNKEIAHLVMQLDNVRILKDGGGKITFEFGLDNIHEIQKLINWNGRGELNFAVAVTPLEKSETLADEWEPIKA